MLGGTALSCFIGGDVRANYSNFSGVILSRVNYLLGRLFIVFYFLDVFDTRKGE